MGNELTVASDVASSKEVLVVDSGVENSVAGWTVASDALEGIVLGVSAAVDSPEAGTVVAEVSTVDS